MRASGVLGDYHKKMHHTHGRRPLLADKFTLLQGNLADLKAEVLHLVTSLRTLIFLTTIVSLSVGLRSQTRLFSAFKLQNEIVQRVCRRSAWPNQKFKRKNLAQFMPGPSLGGILFQRGRVDPVFKANE